MAELIISNFNIAFFQPPRNPLPDEIFSGIYSAVQPHFPIADQISNPILIARRKGGGEINMNPVFIQFLNLETKDIDYDLKMTKEITDIYFNKYRTEKVHQIAIRLVSIVEASFQDGERQLIKNESIKLSPNNAKILSPDKEVKIGVRLVFRRSDKRYDLRIEPYFKKLECNHVDFNIVRPDLVISPNDVYNLVNEEILFFRRDLSTLIP
jgi:hypothetical protein